jgi:hypothetical protein
MCIKFIFHNSVEAIEYGRKHKGDVEAIKNLAIALIDNIMLRDRQTKAQKKEDYTNNCQLIRKALEIMTGEA